MAAGIIGSLILGIFGRELYGGLSFLVLVLGLVASVAAGTLISGFAEAIELLHGLKKNSDAIKELHLSGGAKGTETPEQ